MSDSISSISGAGQADQTQQWAQKLFKKLDANGDGKLDTTELSAMSKDGKGPSAQEILKKFDANGDGSIDQAENLKAVQSMPHHHKKHAQGTQGKGDMFAELMKQLQASQADQTSGTSGTTTADDIMKALDTNGDGKVDKSEIQAILDKVQQSSSLASTYSTDGNKNSAIPAGSFFEEQA